MAGPLGIRIRPLASTRVAKEGVFVSCVTSEDLQTKIRAKAKILDINGADARALSYDDVFNGVPRWCVQG